MHLPALLPFLTAVIYCMSGNARPPQHLFNNPTDYELSGIPTSYESAVMARRILQLTPRGTLSTIFSASSDALENRPSGLQGIPIGLMDYVADCEQTGDPTILAIDIATSFKNVAAGSNISLFLQWTPLYPPGSRIEESSRLKPKATSYSAANLPRFSLLGYLEKIDRRAVEELQLEKCFTKVHPDARYWLPGNEIHESEWMRLVVTQIYWVGGFGDRAYIGWIPVEEWRNITRVEWEGISLLGEKKGWSEW